MKRWIFGFIGVIGFLFAFSSCVNSLEDRSLSSEKQYGSLVWNDESEKSLSRALNVGGIKTARISVCGFGMEEVSSSAVITVSNGKGSAEVKNIPVGKNRIVTVTGYSDSGAKTSVSGAVLRAVLDIASGKNTLSEINWTTSRKGYVYNALLEDGVDISNLSAEQISAIGKAIPDVDVTNINLELFVSDFNKGSGTLQESSAYILSPEKTLKRLVVCESYDSTESAPCFTATAYYSDGNNADVTSDSGTTWSSNKPGVASVSGGKVTLNAAGTTVVSATYTYGGTSETGATQTITVKASGVTIDKLYLVPNSNWTQENATFEAYMWNGSKNSFVVMTKEGDKYVADCDRSVYTNVIFLRCDPSKTANSWENIWNRSAEQTIPDNKDTFTINDGQWGDSNENGTGASGTWALTGSYSGGNLIATINPEEIYPNVGVSVADGKTFTSSISVTITAKNCTASYYTLDGTDPKTSGTREQFSLSKTLTLGSDVSAGESVKVRVYGTDGILEDELTATYTKQDVSLTPTRLGAYYTKSQTSFSIWSPDSSTVKVAVKKQGESDFTEYTCTAGFTVDGDYPDSANIYGVTVPGDCNLAEYQFYIGKAAVRDPYGKMIKYVENKYPQDENVLCDNTNFYPNGPIGSSWAGPSVNIVVDAENILPSDGFWAERPTLDSRTDSIVYEVHVGDFTSSSTWNGTAANRGKFSGMVESGTKYTKGSTTVRTGFDHLKELGITHVQIMPMYDFATKYVNETGQYYNWGYDPVNYNVPEDRYSTCPGDYVKRIREVKDMVNEFHKAGIRVVMDVVYNHTFANEMFENISSSYYTGTNLSGCGNSVDVTKPMVSRMVRDSLEYWAEVYNIDGFRFDLMAIFTKNALYDWGNYLNNINEETKDRKLLMQGEPWMAENNNSSDYGYASAIPDLANAHVGCFSGKFRETLKGSSDDGNTLGYIFAGRTDKDGDFTYWNTTVGIRGSGTSLGSDNEGVWTRYFTAKPEQTVNYLMAHDNLCFYDKIAAAGTSYTGYADAIVKFGHGILLSSQGIPFIHAGDEFLRTKAVGTFSKEAHNSYMWGIEMNQIDWSYKAEYVDCFNYHKDMIAFRKNNDGLRYRNGVGSTSIDGNVITYTVSNTNSSPENPGKTLTIVINPGSNKEVSGKGTMVMNKTGAVSLSSIECEGTGVTIFAK